VVEHGIEARPAVSAFGAADAGVPVNLDHFPATALGDLAKLADLVFDRLVVCADADIQRGPFHLFDHWNPRLSPDFDAFERRKPAIFAEFQESISEGFSYGLPNVGYYNSKARARTRVRLRRNLKRSYRVIPEPDRTYRGWARVLARAPERTMRYFRQELRGHRPTEERISGTTARASTRLARQTATR
jgi:hypothetical protein